MDEALLNRARQFIAALPHSRRLGMVLETLDEGMAEISMPYDTALIGDAQTGVMHGGAVSALMDTAGGTAVMAHGDAGAGTATLDLRIDYMRAAQPGDQILARAECYHMTQNVAFVRATAHDSDTNSPVATANGAFAVTRPKQRKQT